MGWLNNLLKNEEEEKKIQREEEAKKEWEKIKEEEKLRKAEAAEMEKQKLNNAEVRAKARQQEAEAKKIIQLEKIKAEQAESERKFLLSLTPEERARILEEKQLAIEREKQIEETNRKNEENIKIQEELRQKEIIEIEKKKNENFRRAINFPLIFMINDDIIFKDMEFFYAFSFIRITWNQEKDEKIKPKQFDFDLDNIMSIEFKKGFIISTIKIKFLNIIEELPRFPTISGNSIEFEVKGKYKEIILDIIEKFKNR